MVTIGGFATEMRVPGFPGVLIGDSPNLARTSGHPRIDTVTFRDWLKRAENGLAKAATEFGRGVWYASLSLEFQLRPTKIPCFLFRKAILGYDGLAAAKLPGTVSIVLEHSFRWTLPNGETTEMPFEKVVDSDQLQLESGIIVAPVIETGLHAADRGESWPRWNGEFLPTFHSIDGRPFPWTLPLLAVEAVARNWGLDPEVLVHPVLDENRDELMTQFGAQIGTYAETPIKTNVLTLQRPRKTAGSRR